MASLAEKMRDAKRRVDRVAIERCGQDLADAIYDGRLPNGILARKTRRDFKHGVSVNRNHRCPLASRHLQVAYFEQKFSLNFANLW
jgi:hypothetical protein